MRDRIVLITGATSGFGQYVASRLAAAGAQILLHGRSQDSVAKARGSLLSEVSRANIETYAADLSDLSQVVRLADEITAKHQKLDVLINNAGIGFGAPQAAREFSHDGFELRLAVNYLAPFLLTHRLLPLLKAAEQGRIVNVASLGQAPLDFDDLMLEHGYSGVRAYGQSKLALIMATLDLAEELKDSRLTANTLHPATYADTKMVYEAGVAPQSTVADGGEPIAWLATAPELARTTGVFFNQKSPSRADSQAYDRAARQRLRELTARLLSKWMRGA